MYSKSRPVPSRAALRVLYHLAYIGSGTAAGFATLCAEERRRRTQIVQRIADNAQRLRQSPRYYENVTAAADPTESPFFQHSAFEEEKKKEKRADTTQDGPFAKSGMLPSVVERDYAQLFDYVPQSKQVRMHSLGSSEERGDHTGITHMDLSDIRQDEPSEDQTSLRRMENAAKRPSSFAGQLVDWGRYDADSNHHTRRSHVPTDDIRGKSPGPPPVDLKNSVEAFLRKARSPSEHDAPTLAELKGEADALVPRALEIGDIALLQPLVSWKLSQNHFIFEDALLICETAERLFKSNDDSEVLVLFKSILERMYSAKGTDQEHKRMVDLSLEVFTVAVNWTSLTMHSLRAALLDRLVSQKYTISYMLESACRKLADAKRVQSAVKVYLTIRHKEIPKSRFGDVSKLLFDAALDDQLLSSAATVLRRIDSRGKGVVMQPELCEKFLQSCEAQAAYVLVYGLFAHPRRRLTSADIELSSAAHEIIAFAWLKLDKVTRRTRARFEAHLHRVPAHMQRRILALSSARTLLDGWRTTRNLTLVRADYDKKLSWLEVSQDLEAVINLHVAMSEIYVAAGDIDSALAILLKLKNKNADTEERATFVAAAMLAKGARPSTLKQFLDRAHASGLLNFTKQNSKRFEGILSTLAKRLHLPSLLNLIIKAVDKYGFTAGAQTTETIIRASVWQKNLDFLEPWFKFLIKRNQPPNFDSHMAMSALRELHRSQKPPVDQLLGMIIRILRAAPRLAERKVYLKMFHEAAAWHIQNTSFRRGVDTKHFIEQLVMKLENYEDFITRRTRDKTGTLLRCFKRKRCFHIQSRSVADTGHFITLDASESALELLVTEHDKPSKPRPDALMGPERGPESLMFFYLSTQRYDRVLGLYHATLDGRGLPYSLFALQLAVDASAKAHSDPDQTRQLLAAAEAAGFDVSSAATPFMQRSLKTLEKGSWSQPKPIHDLVIEHYRTDAKERIDNTPHLVNTAAYLMIRGGQPTNGINLLNSIFSSDLAERPQPDIASMTIYLRAYSALDDWAGIQWVIETVLAKDILLTPKFMEALRAQTLETHERKGPSHPLYERIDSWRRRCKDRKDQQRHDAQTMGHELTSRLLALAGLMDHYEDTKHKRVQTVVDVTSRSSYSPSSPSPFAGVEEVERRPRAVACL